MHRRQQSCTMLQSQPTPRTTHSTLLARKTRSTLHEAVAAVDTDIYEDQQIVDELQAGFMYKQRLLRAARVRVASNPKSAKAKAQTASSGLGSVDDSGEETILKLD